MVKTVDAVMIGRAGVDLYGEQIGGRLEDMGSFAKYIGGSPTNTSIGAARLGLNTALITRVGNDAMGRFIREELQREGVNTAAVRTDPDRLTALVLLGIRDQVSFPLIFYRENCADMAISVDDIDEALIASARAVVTSGTHFSTPGTKAASLRALELAAKHDAARIIDLDYRPVLWGLADKGDGETRFVSSQSVTSHLQEVLSHMDVVVGTEEEIHIAGGSTDTLEALRSIRAVSQATFVVKLGAQGCVVIEGAVPASLDQGLMVDGFPIEVFNVLGAGDAFMGGLLRGYLRGEDWHTACRYANACGAFAVSRHACAPSYPSEEEMQTFIAHGSDHFRLREDQSLNQLHWSTTRQGELPEVLAFAFDHRSQLEALCDDPAKIGDFKRLCAEVTAEAVTRHPDRQLGALCDHRLGQEALFDMAEGGLWLAAPIELPGSRPLRFEGGPSLAGTLREWPKGQVVKCLCYTHPDDDDAMWQEQRATLLELFTATRQLGLELLLEFIPPADMPKDTTTLARSMAQAYEAGIYPDWWKLPAPEADDWQAEWDAWNEVIEAYDPHCRGVLLLGLAAPREEVRQSIARASEQPLCKGFAVGRTIFGEAAEGWFAGSLDDSGAKALMTAALDDLIGAWSAS